MGRRTKGKPAWVELVLQSTLLLALASLLWPPSREMWSNVGSLGLGVMVLLLAGLIAFGVYRASTRWRRAKGCAGAPAIEPPIPPAIDFQRELRAIDWFQFEKLVAWVCQKLDYTVTRRGGANPDGGIDLVIEKAGELTAVQCKQWRTWHVGVKVVREFLGALTDAGIKRGILIALNGFTGEARELALKHGIEVVSEHELARMLELTDAKSDPEVLAILRDPRKFCPKCEQEMVLRTAGRGSNAGRQFWGCTAYPRCRGSMPAD